MHKYLHMPFGLSRYLAIVVLLMGAGLSSNVHAKGIPIINTGDIMFEVEDLPAPMQAANPTLSGWKIGYKCSHFGLFWATIWSWDCSLVAFKDDTYSDFPDEMRDELAKEYPMSDAKRGVWEHYGALIVLGILLLLGIGSRMRGS